MPLVEIHADFAKLLPTLVRIADALDRAFPKPEDPSKEFLDVQDLHNVLEFQRDKDSTYQGVWSAFDNGDNQSGR